MERVGARCRALVAAAGLQPAAPTESELASATQKWREAEAQRRAFIRDTETKKRALEAKTERLVAEHRALLAQQAADVAKLRAMEAEQAAVAAAAELLREEEAEAAKAAERSQQQAAKKAAKRARQRLRKVGTDAQAHSLMSRRGCQQCGSCPLCQALSGWL